MERINWRAFQNRVQDYFENELNKDFVEDKKQRVGYEQVHEFDLVSEDGNVVIECKSYTWVKGGKIPSAKISALNEALFLMSRVEAERKMIVIQDDFREDGSSLAQYYVDKYDGLMDDVEVWSYRTQDSIETDEVVKIRDSGDIYYSELLFNRST